MLSIMDLKNLVLRPNCLITPSPLAFVPGPSSLFFYDKPFAWLPEFLFEHGYKTNVIRLPFRYKKARTLAFKKWLSLNHTEHFHFILAHKTYLEFKDLIPKSMVASMTLLTSKTAVNPQLHLPNETPFHIEKSDLALFSIPPFYLAHQLICLSGEVAAIPYSQTFSNASKSLYDRFLDHCIKLAESELYA